LPKSIAPKQIFSKIDAGPDFQACLVNKPCRVRPDDKPCLIELRKNPIWEFISREKLMVGKMKWENCIREKLVHEKLVTLCKIKI